MVKNVVHQLLDYGEVRRGMLGVTGTELNADLAENFGFNQNAMAPLSMKWYKMALLTRPVLSQVTSSPLSMARMLPLSVSLRAIVATQRAGSKITGGIFRDGVRSSILRLL